MAISMNNHEQRITALENAVRLATNPDYRGGDSYTFAGGLQIKMGSFYMSPSQLETVRRINFPTPFPKNCISAMLTCKNTHLHYQAPGPAYLNGCDKNGIDCYVNYDDHRVGIHVWYLAIGYLVSNSVTLLRRTIGFLSEISENLCTKIKELKGLGGELLCL